MTSREANNSVRFRTAYNVRGRAYAISRTGGLQFGPATYDIPGQTSKLYLAIILLKWIIYYLLFGLCLGAGRLRASRPAVLRPRREVLSLHWACERAGNARRADIPGSMAWS